MAIPNTEICSIYRQSILTWFDKKMKETDKGPLIVALEQRDCQVVENFISSQFQDTISYFDYKESYYHCFLTGLLTGVPGYQTVSNRESGIGRPDLIVKSRAIRKGRAIILELKMADSIANMEAKCKEALLQIEEQRYEKELLKDGYPVVVKYGICFTARSVWYRAHKGNEALWLRFLHVFLTLAAFVKYESARFSSTYVPEHMGSSLAHSTYQSAPLR